MPKMKAEIGKTTPDSERSDSLDAVYNSYL